MKDAEKLGFDDDPEVFPSVWESGEDGIEVKIQVGNEDVVDTTLPINNIINKHVYLSLKEFLKNDCWFLLCPVTYEPEGLIVCEATVGLGEHGHRDFNIEKETERLGCNMYSKVEFLGMAHSLERAAQTLRRFAENQK